MTQFRVWRIKNELRCETWKNHVFSVEKYEYLENYFGLWKNTQEYSFSLYEKKNSSVSFFQKFHIEKCRELYVSEIWKYLETGFD